MYTGRFVIADATRHRKDNDLVYSIQDHPLNPKLGLLVLASIWGARKRDRKKILLSEGAKNSLLKVIPRDGDTYPYYGKKIEDTGTTFTFIPREGKIPKMIISREPKEDYLVLIAASGGFRGGYALTLRGATKLLGVSAGGAWGSSGFHLVHMPVGSTVIVKHTGRLYGAKKYTVIIASGQGMRRIPVDDLSELEVD